MISNSSAINSFDSCGGPDKRLKLNADAGDAQRILPP